MSEETSGGRTERAERTDGRASERASAGARAARGSRAGAMALTRAGLGLELDAAGEMRAGRTGGPGAKRAWSSGCPEAGPVLLFPVREPPSRGDSWVTVGGGGEAGPRIPFPHRARRQLLGIVEAELVGATEPSFG
ncbi:Hypothetical predicted protein [Podarcis lilfordi]|uniref:Uncharacterized protein n=1 Tax=Podarcis lilfordi TaxID=74358 RepID=A0AA35KQR1_9SAUR|nr:Hypothetical predicted protein [Podarcis lilfordi]